VFCRLHSLGLPFRRTRLRRMLSQPAAYQPSSMRNVGRWLCLNIQTSPAASVNVATIWSCCDPRSLGLSARIVSLNFLRLWSRPAFAASKWSRESQSRVRVRRPPRLGRVQHQPADAVIAAPPPGPRPGLLRFGTSPRSRPRSATISSPVRPSGGRTDRGRCCFSSGLTTAPCGCLSGVHSCVPSKPPVRGSS